MEARPANLIPLFTPRRETPAAPERRAYRVTEIAELYGLSRGAVYQACESGQLRHFRVGRAIVVPVDAVEAWLAGNAGESRL